MPGHPRPDASPGRSAARYRTGGPESRSPDPASGAREPGRSSPVLGARTRLPASGTALSRSSSSSHWLPPCVLTGPGLRPAPRRIAVASTVSGTANVRSKATAKTIRTERSFLLDTVVGCGLKVINSERILFSAVRSVCSAASLVEISFVTPVRRILHRPPHSSRSR